MEAGTDSRSTYRQEPLIKLHRMAAAAATGAIAGFGLGKATGQEGGRLAGWIGGAALLAAAASAASDALAGTGYDYGGYSGGAFARRRRGQPRTAVIYFSGGAAGDYYDNNPDVAFLDNRFGRGRYALFSKNDMEEAVAYALSLPKGTRLRVMGHSMGGPAAVEFADRLGELGMGVYRLDTLDPVGSNMSMAAPPTKPPNVKRWHNYVPKTRDMSRPTNGLAVAGGAWGKVNGAVNHTIRGKNSDHRLIRWSVPSDIDRGTADDDSSEDDAASTSARIFGF